MLNNQSLKVNMLWLGLLGVWLLVNEVSAKSVGSQAPPAWKSESHSTTYQCSQDLGR